jgi:alpha-amylase
MGFKSILTEGAKHILGWKSPNYLYCNAINPRLKVLLRNFVMSDDIAFRFSNKSWSAWPLTADKYATWISKLAPKSELLNIFLDYETFGEHNWKETGIFDFLQHLPGAILKKTPFKFMTPSEVAETLQPVSAINVPSSISWADEERDITAWLGNELQLAAFEKLYELSDKVSRCNDEQMRIDWEYLQSSDHFYYMATKFFSDGAVHAYFNPYETPYDAFMNYMNVLSDFEIRLNRQSPDTHEQRQILKLDNQILEKDLVIEKLTAEIQKLNEKRTKILGEDLIIPEKGGKTSLKDLAHKLITVSAEEQPPRNASSGTKKEKTKIVKKATAKKTTAKKATAKKATTGKIVKKKSTAVKSRKIIKK